MARIFLTVKGDPDGSLPECPAGCLGRHPLRLYVIRRAVRPWGHFVTASVNAEVRVIDASLPTEVDRVPRGAKAVAPADAAAMWHDASGSHVFGW